MTEGLCCDCSGCSNVNQPEDLDGDASYTTYSFDGLHPNQAGHDRIGALVSAAINALGSSVGESE